MLFDFAVITIYLLAFRVAHSFLVSPRYALRQVVWGHEHECLIDPSESVVGTFRITQPGSSVATSLTGGEAVRKQVGLLEIKYNQFRLKSIPLTQVRSFVMGEVSLQDRQRTLDPEDPNIDKKVTAFLEEEVNVLKHEAIDKYKNLLRDAAAAGNAADTDKLKYKLQKPEEVLVRLKVEHTGFSTLNNQRFGAKFVGALANPVRIVCVPCLRCVASPRIQ